MYVEINLTPAEIVQAAFAGIMRQTENTVKGRRHKHGFKEDNDWQIHVEGALGECALAKHLGLYWSGKGGIGEPDVGGVMEIRTASNHTDRLIVRPDDEDDRQMWFATGKNGRYRIHGWITVEAAKQPKWLCDPTGHRPPAWFVPAKTLTGPGPGRS